ncbi:MAG: dual specificity protein phosphatase family protein [Cyanobacteria bacterium SZAS-4]|nr:dual specificity protein phosphatase family protein [Cyanobacteria bacterium SZAS-4]
MKRVDVARSAKVLMLALVLSAPAAAASDSKSGAVETSSSGKSEFSSTFSDLLKEPEPLNPGTTSDAMPPTADAPKPQVLTPQTPASAYGKPLADTIERESAGQLKPSDSKAEPSTLAPFRRANNTFAPLHGIQLPRPLNIPAAASPSLKQAAAMIPNMSVVSNNLVRGSQPSVPALSLLKSAGIKTIVNLRNEDILVAQEGAAAKRAGLNYVNIPMALFETPTKQQFQKFLNTVDKDGPVFVHCQKGEDRTGTMVAVYRMARENWDPNRAYQEMTAMGFKTFLGSLSGAVFDYSASLGRPARRPMPDFSGFTSILSH